MSDELLDAIVLGCNYANVLGVIKSIGEGGYSVGLIRHTTTLVKKYPTPDTSSKYTRKWRYVDRANDQAMLEALLGEFNAAPHRAALVAADDYSASFLERYYERLAPFYRLTHWEDIRKSLTFYEDKDHQKAAAQACGLRVAHGTSIKIPRRIERLVIPDDVVYPCILKPELSAGTGMSKALIAVCQNESELRDYFAGVVGNAEGSILCEELLDIECEYTVPGLRLEGEVVVPSFIKKIVTGTGKVKGVTVMGLVEPAETQPDTLARIIDLAHYMGIEGMFDVELIQSNGELFFNEINLRSSAATYGNTGAGVNLPKMVVDYLVGNDWRANNRTIAAPMKFINEKPALACYAQGDMSLDEFRALRDSADIRLLTGDDDAPAKAAFDTYVTNRKIAAGVIAENDGDDDATGETDEGSSAQRARIAKREKELAYLEEFRKTLVVARADDGERGELRETLSAYYLALAGDDGTPYFSAEKIDQHLERAFTKGAVFTAKKDSALVGIATCAIGRIDRAFHKGTAVRLQHFVTLQTDGREAIREELMAAVEMLATAENDPIFFSAARRRKKLFAPLRALGFVDAEMRDGGRTFELTVAKWPAPLTVNMVTVKRNFTNSVLRTYTQKRVDPATIHDSELQSAYKRNFYRFTKSADDEALADMLAAFDDIGATPREYALFGLADKRAKDRVAYITVEGARKLEDRLRAGVDYADDQWRAIKNRWEIYCATRDANARCAELVQTDDDFAHFIREHECCVAKPLERANERFARITPKTSDDRKERLARRFARTPHMIEVELSESNAYPLFHKNYAHSVRLVTKTDAEGSSILFALLNVECTLPESEWLYTRPAYAVIDARTGVVSGPLVDSKTHEKAAVHPRTKIVYPGIALPEWGKLRKIILAGAHAFSNIPLIGWDARYTDQGWAVDDATLRPSFREVQLALGQGIGPL